MLSKDVTKKYLKSKGVTIFPEPIPNDPSVVARRLKDGWYFAFCDEKNGAALNVACRSLSETEFELLLKLFHDLRLRD